MSIISNIYVTIQKAQALNISIQSLNPMFLFFISSISFMPWFWERLSAFMVSCSENYSLVINKDVQSVGSGNNHKQPSTMSLKKKMMTTKLGSNAEEYKMSLPDLPELVLECILERLSPKGLCSMAAVCSSFRERCRSDHLWEKHMKQKWGKVIGDAAYREWQWHIASINRPNLLDPNKQNEFWPFSWFRPSLQGTSNMHNLAVDSIMSWYISLETGRFWFPAQVYNRENGHAGFMLSCYDAKLSYDSKTDTFQARYTPYGGRTTEEIISWNRLRVAPIETPPHDLHISECLLDLKPGDHIEIQWRRYTEFPYGWWYGRVSHMESCGGDGNYCHCQYTDTVMIEFKQYPSGSRWRRTMINRKEHREVGDEGSGFYGGIRKLYKEEEISMWKCLWPNHVLE